MSTTSPTTTEILTGSRSWLEDDKNTTPEIEQKHWAEVKKGSDELLTFYWNNYGKWAYFSFASACLLVGGIAGYKRGQAKEQAMGPVPKAARSMAIKALAAGTALCMTVSGAIAGSVIYLGDFKSVDDFQTRMRVAVPALMSPVPRVLENAGLKRKTETVAQPSDYEIGNLDQTMNQAFGKSDYYKEFKAEDYDHQTSPVKPDAKL